MSEAMENPDLTELHKYVPLCEADKPEEIPLCIQANFFKCGGIAVCVCISHKIADMKSLVSFMTSWSSVCCHVDLEQQPSFDLSSHFPPIDLSGSDKPPAETMTADNMVTKRFIFDKEMLLALKNIGASSEVPNPSKIEALTAFLWGNFMVSDISNDRKRRTTYPVLHKNLTVFIDTKTGDGIEAWVTMDELDLAMIENNYTHLLSNATALEIS